MADTTGNNGKINHNWKRKTKKGEGKIEKNAEKGHRRESNAQEETQRLSSGYSLLVRKPSSLPLRPIQRHLVSFYAKMCGKNTLRAFGNNRPAQQRDELSRRG